MSTSSIGDALFTKTQQKVLSLIYGHPGKSFYTNEIMRWADMGRGTVRRELERMTSSGLLTISREGNQLHYQANPDCPIYEEVLSIVRKTFGVGNVIRDALSPQREKIDWAFIFGSVADGSEGSFSDIDLMIIGELGFAEAVTMLYPVQEKLGREINPKIYHRDEWMKMNHAKDAFLMKVLSRPKIDLIGDGHELG
jgi:predicted nucleotidyltransferase